MAALPCQVCKRRDVADWRHVRAGHTCGGAGADADASDMPDSTFGLIPVTLHGAEQRLSVGHGVRYLDSNNIAVWSAHGFCCGGRQAQEALDSEPPGSWRDVGTEQGIRPTQRRMVKCKQARVQKGFWHQRPQAALHCCALKQSE